MGARFSDYREVLAYGSGTAGTWSKGTGTVGGGEIIAYWGTNVASQVSLQITRMTTGSIVGLTFETSNHYDARPDTIPSGLWAVEEGPHSASLLTASAASSPASKMYQVGNLNSRWFRARVAVGTGDVFRLAFHGKED